MSAKYRAPAMILVCLIMILSSFGPVWAKTSVFSEVVSENSLSSVDFLIMPMSVYINRTATCLSISSSGYATVTGYILAYQGLVDEVWIFPYLEKYENGAWQPFASWYEIYYTYYGFLQKSISVPHGYYRVRCSYYAWSGSNYEQVTGYSSYIIY